MLKKIMKLLKKIISRKNNKKNSAWNKYLDLSIKNPEESLLKSRITIVKKGFFCERKSYGIGLNLHHPKVQKYLSKSKK